MNRIEKLIDELCPNGVPFEPLATLGRWYGGGTPSKSKPEYWADATIPWVTPKDMGPGIVESTIDCITESAIEGSAARLLPEGSVAMVVRSSILDHTFPVALVPVSVALNQDMKAIAPRSDVLAAYLAHLLRARGHAILRHARKFGGSVASIESSKLHNFRIPIPPVEVQREIVRVLDEYGDLERELSVQLDAELEARRKQYAHYRESLLTPPEGRRLPMGEAGQFIRGRRFTKKDVVPSGIPSIHYGEIYTHYGVAATSALNHVRDDMAAQLRYARSGDVVIAGVGETVEDVGKAVAWLGDEEVAIHDDTFLFRSDLNPKYVAYVLQTAEFHAQKANHVARGKVKRLSSAGLARIEIPVPGLAEQERVVAILDDFAALVNDLGMALPAELAARRKQYKHYCDRLLTFKEVAA